MGLGIFLLAKVSSELSQTLPQVKRQVAVRRNDGHARGDHFRPADE